MTAKSFCDSLSKSLVCEGLFLWGGECMNARRTSECSALIPVNADHVALYVRYVYTCVTKHFVAFTYSMTEFLQLEYWPGEHLAWLLVFERPGRTETLPAADLYKCGPLVQR